MNGKGIDAIAARGARIRRVEGMIQALDEVAYSKALSVICYNIGVSDIKGREYLRILEGTGAIKIKDGVIYPRKPETKKGKKKDQDPEMSNYE